MSPAGCKLQSEPTWAPRQKKTKKGRASKNGWFKPKTEFELRFVTFHSTFVVRFNVMQKNMLKDAGNPDKGTTQSHTASVLACLCLPCRGPNVVGSGADCRRAVLPEMSSPTWHRHWPVLLTLTVPPQRVTLGIPYTCGRHCHPPQFNPIRTNPLQSRWWIEWLEWWKERVAIVHGGRRESGKNGGTWRAESQTKNYSMIETGKVALCTWHLRNVSFCLNFGSLEEKNARPLLIPQREINSSVVW